MFSDHRVGGKTMPEGKPYKKTFDNKIDLSSKKLRIILDFYLFQCPVENKSKRGKTFEQLGWKGSNQFGALKRKMLKKATISLKSNYKPCKKDELKKAFLDVKKIRSPDEYCVFLKFDEETVMQSLFSAIRNALAHGSFAVRTYDGKRIYFFSNYKEYLKAEIVLHEETLLNWIRIVKAGFNALD